MIFVEENEAIPEDELTMKVALWDGDEKEYKVPLMRYWKETLATLEEKHLEPLLPLQVFKLRKELQSIERSKKPDEEKEQLTKEKLEEIVKIYTAVTEKIRILTEEKGQLTIFNAEQMLLSLQHLSEYLYSRYKNYQKIESEAIKMSESRWTISKVLRDGEQRGEIKGKIEGKIEGEQKTRKETAHDMFIGGENILKIKKYSKLPDDDLADVLRSLPKEVQNKYSSVFS